ncbi:MAG: Fic family protein [Bacteroidota bacterium]
MILNNYRAMELVRGRIKEPLTARFIEEIQRVVTRNTETDGLYRTSGDGIAVYDDQNQLLHTPPPAEQIEERMSRLCEFANETETGVFLHPVLKSIILHFWMAYDHPFVDGNGRTARALFYWSMLKEGFWLAEFLSVSAVLKRAPARYAESFLYTETDENDVTYFMLAQLRAIEAAVDELKSHLRKKAREIQETEALLGPDSGFNHRQRSILGHALRYPEAVFDIASEKKRHGVAYATARSDLQDLAQRGLLGQERKGKKYVFRSLPDLGQRVANGTASRGD